MPRLVLFAVPTATHDPPMRIPTVIGWDLGSFRMLTTTTRLISVRTVRARAADRDAGLTASLEAVTPQPGHETRVTPRPRLRDAGQDAVATAVPDGSFAIVLPTSPLSYEGVIVKVRWCVRVRIFFEGGKDFVSEHVFEVGQIPPARNRREPLA